MMAWSDETLVLLRSLILDDLEPFEYSDERLTQVLVGSAFQVYQRTKDRLSRTYEIDVVNQTITPDPAGTSLSDPDRDESFLNLMVLKAGCSLQQGSVRRVAGSAYAVKSGSDSFDGRPRANVLADLLNGNRSLCAEYEEELRKWMADRTAVAGAAIIGPYRTGFSGLPATAGSRRGSW